MQGGDENITIMERTIGIQTNMYEEVNDETGECIQQETLEGC